jgi:ribonucleoside-diphosphate reductase beta chain
MTEIVSSNIFDAGRQYKTTTGSVFLEAKRGLLDSINKRLPTVWALYKQLKTMDWDENEFPYKDAKTEFVVGDKDASEAMVETLGWQWETDSVASHHLVPLMAPFVTSSEYWVALCRIQDNENVHALTYSEIVRNSFDDPDAVMKKVLDSQEPLKRLSAVIAIMDEALIVGSKLNLGQISRESDQARDTAMLLAFAFFVLERVQFMPSFAVTFGVTEKYGSYMPIAKAVQKICNDEFNIHVEVGREIIRNELLTVPGRASYQRCLPRIATLIEEVVNCEMNWTREYLFRNGRVIPNCTADSLCDFIRFSATDVYNECPGLVNPFGNVTENPLPYMEDWVEMDKNQAAPQEEKPSNYLLGNVIHTVGNRVFEIEGFDQ